MEFVVSLVVGSGSRNAERGKAEVGGLEQIADFLKNLKYFAGQSRTPTANGIHATHRTHNSL
jgi:hypothetical protein